MSQTIPEMIAGPSGKDLGLALEAAESAGMKDTITVALEVVTIRMGEFRKTAAAQTLRGKAQATQHRSAIYCGS